MNFRIRILSSFAVLAMALLLTFCLGQGGFTLAADPESVPDKPSPKPRSLISLTEEQAAKLDPLNREIRQVLLVEKAEVDRLTASLADETDDAEALAIQRLIGFVKQQAEIDVMQVQARFAEEAGHHEEAEAIREALTGMKEQLAEALEVDGGRP